MGYLFKESALSGKHHWAGVPTSKRGLANDSALVTKMRWRKKSTYTCSCGVLSLKFLDKTLVEGKMVNEKEFSASFTSCRDIQCLCQHSLKSIMSFNAFGGEYLLGFCLLVVIMC